MTTVPRDQLHIEYVALSKLRPWAKNPRENDKAAEHLAELIGAHGFINPIICTRDGVIRAGHTRMKAAKAQGLKTVPVIYVDFDSEASAQAYALADNKSSEFSTWDADMLGPVLTEIDVAGVPLGMTGFSDKELDALMATTPGAQEEPGVPDRPARPETKTGDLWGLGAHRLYCGDSTKPADLKALMGADKAKMLFTDPPWNVAIGQDSNPRHRQRTGLVNDDLPPEEFAAFLNGFAAAMRPHISGDVYCAMGSRELSTLDRALRVACYHWSATIVWCKDAFVLGGKKYHSRYEPLWYGWQKGGKSSFCNRRDLDDVWEIPRPKRSPEHPTMKPVALAARAITYSSRKGDVVLDLFGGSGQTLLAADQNERRAFMMEIDPGYCDVIKMRWAEMTGGTPVLIQAGKKNGKRKAKSRA